MQIELRAWRRMWLYQFAVVHPIRVVLVKDHGKMPVSIVVVVVVAAAVGMDVVALSFRLQ